MSLVRSQRQIGRCDFGDQADLCAAMRFFGTEVLLQRLIFQTADAAEEIELVSAESEADAVDMTDHARACRRKVGRRKRRTVAGTSVDMREQQGAFDLILRLSLFDSQCRNAQVAVIGKRQVDQLPQLGVNHKVAPIGTGFALPGCNSRIGWAAGPTARYGWGGTRSEERRVGKEGRSP